MAVSNLTDKDYATHLNSTNELDGTADRVDEPGRSFLGIINIRFLIIFALHVALSSQIREGNYKYWLKSKIKSYIR